MGHEILRLVRIAQAAGDASPSLTPPLPPPSNKKDLKNNFSFGNMTSIHTVVVACCSDYFMMLCQFTARNFLCNCPVGLELRSFSIEKLRTIKIGFTVD
jgi:hypothetical protein